VKVKIAEKEFDVIVEFLEKYKSLFPIELDRQRIIIEILFKKGDLFPCINQIISTIHHNYLNIDQF
jgi:hypothetical protein